ncbi:unnamed protein product, partial [Pelagomonas calceolata]
VPPIIRVVAERDLLLHHVVPLHVQPPIHRLGQLAARGAVPLPQYRNALRGDGLAHLRVPREDEPRAHPRCFRWIGHPIDIPIGGLVARRDGGLDGVARIPRPQRERPANRARVVVAVLASSLDHERRPPRRHRFGVHQLRGPPGPRLGREEELVIINAQSLLGEARARRRRWVLSRVRRLHREIVASIEPRPEVDLDLYILTVVLEGRVEVRRLDARAVPGLELPRRRRAVDDRRGRAPGAVPVRRLEADYCPLSPVAEIDHVFLQRRRGLQGGVQLVHGGTHRCADVERRCMARGQRYCYCKLHGKRLRLQRRRRASVLTHVAGVKLWS